MDTDEYNQVRDAGLSRSAHSSTQLAPYASKRPKLVTVRVGT